MALQDLTPQLRTRLNRVERAVGAFVMVATLLMLTGLTYYVYHTAKRKGWGIPKVPYYTMIDSAEGLKVGDPVKLWGMDAGVITAIESNDPKDWKPITIFFTIRAPHHGYIGTKQVRGGSGESGESAIKISSSLLGSRYLEITKADYNNTNIVPTFIPTNIRGLDELEIFIDGKPGHYVPLKSYKDKAKGYWLDSIEPLPLGEQVSKLIKQADGVLPALLGLTNQVNSTVAQSSNLMNTLELTLKLTHPVISNVNDLTAQLKRPGAMGEWLIPTQINQQVQGTISTAQGTFHTAETNLVVLSSNLNQTLNNIADITSNLNSQVQANSLILSEISSLIVNADDLLQGLKRNWLLKSSFAPATNKPLESIIRPSRGGVQ